MKAISWKEFDKFLIYVGCTFKRQKGDHRIYWRKDLNRPVVLPTYKSVPPFIIKNNLRLLKISNDQFEEILKKNIV
jgi:predicted RNA binding protein YcfA (HicA-like mRNA interferase family)